VNRIEVRIARRGHVRDGAATRDEAQAARCDYCKQEVDAVASVALEGASGPFACKGCLRGRLEAMTVAAWQLRDAGEGGLPWGKVSG
jgi:hypothetical protein